MSVSPTGVWEGLAARTSSKGQGLEHLTSPHTPIPPSQAASSGSMHGGRMTKVALKFHLCRIILLLAETPGLPDPGSSPSHPTHPDHSDRVMPLVLKNSIAQLGQCQSSAYCLSSCHQLVSPVSSLVTSNTTTLCLLLDSIFSGKPSWININFSYYIVLCVGREPPIHHEWEYHTMHNRLPSLDSKTWSSDSIRAEFEFRVPSSTQLCDFGPLTLCSRL